MPRRAGWRWHGVSAERIRRDLVLREAVTARADPLRLALVFGLSHCTASEYALIACDLLAGQPAGAAGEQHSAPGAPRPSSPDGWIWGAAAGVDNRV